MSPHIQLSSSFGGPFHLLGVRARDAAIPVDDNGGTTSTAHTYTSPTPSLSSGEYDHAYSTAIVFCTACTTINFRTVMSILFQECDCGSAILLDGFAVANNGIGNQQNQSFAE
eukprot:scaffold36048_cov49-Attheya_sp.AAC.4